MVLAQMFLDAVIAVLKKARRGTLCLLDRSLNAASDREFLAPGLHSARRMKPFLLALLAFALTMAACSSSDPASTVTSPSATTTTETFTGTVQPNFGVDFHAFTVAQAGSVNVTLTAAGPPATIFMGVGIGTPSATTCATISGDSTIAPASTTAQLTGTLAAGSYCVQVYDVGNEASPVTYSVTVAHT
jgi:hypothetical protein